ncbi:hypothetical protein [Streptomyces sp. NPDC047928]
MCSKCRTVLADLRIAARRGATTALREIARPLPALAARLRGIEGRTPT